MEALQWIFSVGTSFVEAIELSGELSRLRISLPRAHVLADRAEWGRFNHNGLVKLLLQLKDTIYDSEDLLREFDDQILRQKMEDSDRSRAGQLVSSSLNIAKSLISGSKTRVQEAQRKLDKVVAEIEGVLNLMGLNVEQVQLGKQHMPETSSLISEPVVLGRDEERDRVIKLLGLPPTGSRSAKRLKQENVTVLPIVGIGGVGKTTLAQLIYNDSRVKAHFDIRVWVCVSDLFDIKRITAEIIGSTSDEASDSRASLHSLQVERREYFNSSRSLDDLQGELKERLKEKKFILVLDDVWPNANHQWQKFSAPLRYGRHGSTILVTTRSLNVVGRVSTIEPVKLEGLPAEIFWEFFKKCAFGNECPESYPELKDIGQCIVSRLCGSPLAAKTLGRLLSDSLTEQHWRSIQKSELWELPHQENDILPALQLSYLYLPMELKRCFAICSMFPKDYSFERDEMIGIWVAEGFVVPGGSMHIEDMGSRYLDDLRSRFLIQSDPTHPGVRRYVMHDLIHDMALSVSLGECFLMQDSSHQNRRKMPETVRHMSIEVSSEALSKMEGLEHLGKLRSLRFASGFKGDLSMFNQLSNILFLSLKGCKLVLLPESICVLNHLRHLDISDSSIEELPKDFGRLYSLQVLDATGSCLKTVHEGVTELVNLRHLELPYKARIELSKMSGLGNLSSLRELLRFTVGTENGRKIGELKSMNQLCGLLHIDCIAKVKSVAEIAEARLADKQYLKTLSLRWRQRRCSLKSAENEVLEALRPPSGVKCLRVCHFGGDNFSPSWLKSENRPTVRGLELSECHSLRYFSIPSPSLETLVLNKMCIEVLTTSVDGILTDDGSSQHPRISRSNGIPRLAIMGLTTLQLHSCKELTNLDRCLSPEYLPSIKSVELVRCTGLLSLPVHKFGGFVCLQELKIQECLSLSCEDEMVLPPSLQRLSFRCPGELDKSLRPGWLDNLASLALLHLAECRSVESVSLNSISTNKLKCLVLRHCSNLSSLQGLHALSSIQHVEISGCPKLAEVQQPLSKKGLRPQDIEIRFFQYVFL